MKTLIAAVACTFALPAFAQDNPFKGNIKEGQWEYNMKMEMAGLPGGSMAMPAFKQCITKAQLEQGAIGQKDGKMPEGCSIRNMKQSGNNASYTMECTRDPKMKADVKMTFQADSFTMKQDIVMDHGGQAMPVSQTMTGKYLGACR